MRLLTFLEDGAYRIGILTARPGTPDAVVVDVGGAVELLVRQARRITWRTPWRGPWGTLTAPRDMLDVVRHGRQAVIALEDLERTLWHVARTVDGAWAETVCRDPAGITWQPPIPEPPLYLFLSGNTQVMAHQRPPNPPWPVPAPRLRPITALLGHGEPLEADATGTAGSDMELGVVIGPEAAGPAGVDADVAMDHVFGYTVCNDAYDRRYQEKADAAAGGAGVSGVRLGGIATCGKASDGCGPVGPVIVTADEVGSPHDLVASAWFNGRLRARAHTSAYAYSVRDAVAHFARLMTLPAGTILAMGACGYDGHAVHGAFRQAGDNRLAVEFERVGRLEHPIAYADDPHRQAIEGQSRYLARRTRLGLPDAAQPDLTPGDVPARTRSFWALAENHRPAAPPGLPAPYLYPARSLAGGAGPLVLPKHARRLLVSCELAGVVGPRPVHRPAPGEVLPLLLGFAAVLSVLDMSLLDSFPGPRSADTLRFATYQCRFADGCSRIGPVTPVADGSAALAGARLRLALVGPGRPEEPEEARVSDYGVTVEEGVAWIGDGVTLLPADVVSLGPSGATLTIPAEPRLAPGTAVVAGIDGLGEVRVELVDGRDLSSEPWPWPLLKR